MAVKNTVIIEISIIIICMVNFVLPQKLVVEGKKAKIKDFPHSAFLLAMCLGEDEIQTEFRSGHMCGSAIINQVILVTAAHCLRDCKVETDFVVVFVGKANINKGLTYQVSDFKLHKKYDRVKKRNDIALVKLEEELEFGRTVRRVALMKHPPYDEPAEIAGWGLMDVEKKIFPESLMKISQRIWNRSACMEELGRRLPKGTICGGEMDADSYIAHGDSGSGLMVRKYILVGIASFGTAQSHSLAVYTDVGYFYKWIKKTAKALYCSV